MIGFTQYKNDEEPEEVSGAEPLGEIYWLFDSPEYGGAFPNHCVNYFAFEIDGECQIVRFI